MNYLKTRLHHQLLIANMHTKVGVATHLQDVFSFTSFVTSTHTLQSYSAKDSHSALIPLLAPGDRKVSERNETIYTNYTVK